MDPAEAKAGFLLRLRARGIRDLAVLKAMESVSREHFVPNRYADLARRDIALPIACGQTSPEPFVIARAVEALAPDPTCRVLEIGAGSGYATAILAKLFREVLAIERYRSLAEHARSRLQALSIDNAVVVWGDGLDIPPEAGPFDRILLHAELATVPAAFAKLLAPDGAAVFARLNGSEPQQLVRAARGADGAWTYQPLCPSRFLPLTPGPSRAL